MRYEVPLSILRSVAFCVGVFCLAYYLSDWSMEGPGILSPGWEGFLIFLWNFLMACFMFAALTALGVSGIIFGIISLFQLARGDAIGYGTAVASGFSTFFFGKIAVQMYQASALRGHVIHDNKRLEKWKEKSFYKGKWKLIPPAKRERFINNVYELKLNYWKRFAMILEDWDTKNYDFPGHTVEDFAESYFAGEYADFPKMKSLIYEDISEEEWQNEHGKFPEWFHPLSESRGGKYTPSYKRANLITDDSDEE